MQLWYALSPIGKAPTEEVSDNIYNIFATIWEVFASIVAFIAITSTLTFIFRMMSTFFGLFDRIDFSNYLLQSEPSETSSEASTTQDSSDTNN